MASSFWCWVLAATGVSAGSTCSDGYADGWIWSGSGWAYNAGSLWTGGTSNANSAPGRIQLAAMAELAAMARQEAMAQQEADAGQLGDQWLRRRSDAELFDENKTEVGDTTDEEDDGTTTIIPETRGKQTECFGKGEPAFFQS